MEGREKEMQRNIIVWLPLASPQLGTWPTIQAWALTGNWTSVLLVHRPVLNPLIYTSQGTNSFLARTLLGSGKSLETSLSAFNLYFTISLYFPLLLFQETWRFLFFGNWSQIQFFDALTVLLNILGFLENFPVFSSLLSSFLSITHLFILKNPCTIV